MYRTKHELRASRIQTGLSTNSKNDLFEDFKKIEDEFPEYNTSTQLVLSKFCILFSASEIAMSKLPFET